MRMRPSKTKKLWRIVARAYLPVLFLQLPANGSPRDAAPGQVASKTSDFTRIISRTISLRATGAAELALPALNSNRLYSVTVTLSSGGVRATENGSSFAAHIRDSARIVAEK